MQVTCFWSHRSSGHGHMAWERIGKQGIDLRRTSFITYCYASILSLSHALHLWFCYFVICTIGLLFISYWTILDFAIISIFSSYVPLCDMSLIVPYLYRLSHAYVSFYLVSLMTPLHCYAHASLSFEAIDSNSFATYFLPYCAPTCAFLAAYMYFYATYDVFFLQYIRTLVIYQVTSDLVSFVNNRTIHQQNIKPLETTWCPLKLLKSPWNPLFSDIRHNLWRPKKKPPN